MRVVQLVLGVVVLAAVAFALDDVSFMVNTILAAFSLMDAPQLDRYELFYTAYVNSSGVAIVDKPLIPGSNLTEYVRLAQLVMELYKNGTLYFTANETGIYGWINGTLTYALTFTPMEGALELNFANWTTTQLDSNTWLNYTWVETNGSKFLLLVYVRHISDTHKLYVFTLAEEAGSKYARAFTWANYWFKNKTTYFGDWVVVEGADSLSAYYAAMARAVDALADKWKKDKGYVPQAYPQIARALRQISRAVTGTRIDLPVDKGYGLVTDLWHLVYAAAAIGASVGIGVYRGYDTWSRTGDVRRAIACGLLAGTLSLTTAVLGNFNAVIGALYGLNAYMTENILSRYLRC